MKKTLALIIFTFFLAIHSFGQDSDTSKENILVGGFTWETEDTLEAWDNMKGRLIYNINPKEDFLAITICSNDPLPVAINLTRGQIMDHLYDLMPKEIIGVDEKTGYAIFDTSRTVPRERVLFLRETKGCGFVKDKGLSSTYWIIRPNNELPDFVEVRNAFDLDKYDIVFGDTHLSKQIEWGIPRNNDTYFKYFVSLTPQVYKTALEKTVSFMKKNRTAVATIKIPFFGKRPSRIITNRVLQAQKFLKDSGINSSRVYIRKIALDPKATYTEGGNKYPNISVVYEYQPTVASATQK